MKGYFYGYLNRFEPSGTELFNFLIEKKIYPQLILQGDSQEGISKTSKDYLPSLEYIYSAGQAQFENSGFLGYCELLASFSTEELDQLFRIKLFKDHLKSIIRGTDVYFGFLERNTDESYKLSRNKRQFLRTHFSLKMLNYLRGKSSEYASESQIDQITTLLDKLSTRLAKLRERFDPPLKNSLPVDVKDQPTQEQNTIPDTEPIKTTESENSQTLASEQEAAKALKSQQQLKKIQMLKDKMKQKQKKFFENETQKMEAPQTETVELNPPTEAQEANQESSKASSTCTFCLEAINPEDECYIPAFVQFFKRGEGDIKLVPLMSTCGHIMHYKCYKNAEKKMQKKQIKVWDQQTKCMQCQTLANCHLIRRVGGLGLADVERAITSLKQQFDLLVVFCSFKYVHRDEDDPAVKIYKCFEGFFSHVFLNPKSVAMKRFVSNFLPIYRELAKDISKICSPPSKASPPEAFDPNLDLIQRATTWLSAADTELASFLLLRLTLKQSLLKTTEDLATISSILVIYLFSESSHEQLKQGDRASKLLGLVLSSYRETCNDPKFLSLVEENLKKICVLVALFFDSELVEKLTPEQYTKFGNDDISCFDSESGNTLLKQAEIADNILQLHKNEDYSKSICLSFNEPKKLIDLPPSHNEFQLKYFHQGCYLCGGSPSKENNDLMVCLLSGKVFCKIVCHNNRQQEYTNMTIHAVKEFQGQAIFCSLAEAKTYLFSYPACKIFGVCELTFRHQKTHNLLRQVRPAFKHP